ncbi:DegV family protein [Paratractidigestivibacter sp.]|uniref:DegV family protein n=1 Tax=Paratractidigestivibacter sp. TaxID=2847316 RepID=UPI002AC99C3D|nr:DegV family protein [Paratractidigestivibacter sp.]
MSVRIITDSASDILPGEHEGLVVLPLSVSFGEKNYSDGVDLSHERFYELLVEGDELPRTGQVNPYAFIQAFEEAYAAGDDVVCVTLSSALSGTNQSAITAAAEAKVVVRVVDSMSVCVGERVLVEYALHLAAEGLTAVQIADELTAARSRICVVGLLDTLEYLRRGGRIGAAAAGVGSLLSIKPVITVENGAVKLLGQARGSKNGRNLLNQQVMAAGGINFDMPVALAYAGLSDKLLRKYIDDSRGIWEAGFPEGDLPVHTVGATIGTHVGPGAVALAFFKA